MSRTPKMRRTNGFAIMILLAKRFLKTALIKAVLTYSCMRGRAYHIQVILKMFSQVQTMTFAIFISDYMPDTTGLRADTGDLDEEFDLDFKKQCSIM